MTRRWVRLAGDSSQGGNGEVFRVADSAGVFQGDAAQKCLKSERFPRYPRFEREVRVAKGLQHPNIARVLDEFLPTTPTADAPPFYVMPWFPGGTFDVVVKAGAYKGKALDALRAMQPIFEAVSFLHEQGIFHRDIKPSNVLLDASGRPSLTDFGLCFDLDDLDQLTLTPEVVGSLRYRAPEYLSGRLDSTDHAPGDVYSLGRVLWALIAGRAPDEGVNLNYPGFNLQAQFPHENLRDTQFLISLMTAEERERRPRMKDVVAELSQILNPAKPTKGGPSGAPRAIASFLATNAELEAQRLAEERARSERSKLDQALVAASEVMAANGEIAELLQRYASGEHASLRLTAPTDAHPGEHELLAEALGWTDIPAMRAAQLVFAPGREAEKHKPMLIALLGCAQSGRDLRIMAFVYSRANGNLHPAVARGGKEVMSSLDSVNLPRTVATLASWLATAFLTHLAAIWRGDSL